MAPETMRNASIVLIIFYMLIGGGSFSTASGIKINTLIVLFLAVRAYFRQQSQVVLMHRTIPHSTIQKAFALVFITTTWVLLVVFFISFYDYLSFTRIFFDIVYEMIL